MSKRGDLEFLSDIKEAIERICSGCCRMRLTVECHPTNTKPYLYPHQPQGPLRGT